MNYKINWDGGVFAVPDCAADSLKLASGKAVKVLLYIMKYKSEENILSELNITEEDLEDSLSFWEQVGVLYKNGDAPTVAAKAAVPDTSPIQPQNAQPAPTVTAPAPRPVPRPMKAVTPEEIIARLNQSPELRSLMEMLESSLGRTLSFDDQRTVIWISDHLGMLPEVIIMLVNYCVSINRSNMHYIEKVAVSWADEGIDSAILAEQKILALQKSSTLSAKCISRMQLNRQLSSKEKEIVKQWSADDVEIELVMNAYERTINATGKVSFSYMNKIITEWVENGIKTPLEADAYSQQTAPKKQTRSQAASAKLPQKPAAEPSFDLNAIMEHAKNTPLVSDISKRAE